MGDSINFSIFYIILKNDIVNTNNITLLLPIRKNNQSETNDTNDKNVKLEKKTKDSNHLHFIFPIKFLFLISVSLVKLNLYPP